MPQGSPLSPLLFLLATSPLTEAIRTASPQCQPPQFADDLTLTATDRNLQTTAEVAQRALDAVQGWSQANYLSLSKEKTEALVISTDPREVNGKARPALHLDGQQVKFNPNPTILGVKLDSQLTFTPHTLDVAAKMKRRCSALRAIAARDWGADTHTLRQVASAFVVPAGLYAAGAWWPFTAASTRQKLESANYLAARTISGVGAGSRAATTCRDAGLPPLEILARKEAANILLKFRRMPVDHHLHQLALPPPHPPRLIAHGTGGHLRPSWRTEAVTTLATAHLDHIFPEEILSRSSVPAPWSARPGLTFHQVPGTSRETSAAVQGALALDFLASLQERVPPDIQAWTDGAATDGTSNGGGGYIIKWPGQDIPPTTGSVPAGTITSSTAAEAAAAEAALRVVSEELIGTNQSLTIWLVFDSQSLLARLRHPKTARIDRQTASALRHLHQLAATHRVAVIWVPGHAGLPANEAADEAARAGTRLHQPQTRPSYQSAVSRLKRHLLTTESKNRYLAAVPEDSLHRRATGGEPLPLDRRRTRAADVALFQLRANRAPWLKSTQHRWGRINSSACPHCNAPSEDTEHFLLHCPRWEHERRIHLGNGPLTIEVLQDHVRGVLLFVEAAGVLAHPPYVFNDGAARI